MKKKVLISGKEKIQFYVDAIEECGAVAEASYLPKGRAEDYDALVLCGGEDIHPKFYGANINGSLNIDVDRDECELALAEEFIKAGKPVLGICRGCQILNVYFGGELIQHIKNVEVHSGEQDMVHAVIAEKDSVAHNLYGAEFFVNSAHHQAIGRVGNGLFVTIRSKDDEVVEAIQHESLPVIGFQFHPERMCISKRRNDTVDGIKIFQHFISLCK